MRTLILFLAALPLFAAGTVTSTLTRLADTDTYVITVTATGDASDGSFPAHTLARSGASLANTDGFSIIAVETDPGATAPTDNWYLTITNAQGLDLMAATCIDRDTANTERCSADPVPLSGATSINIAGNSVNSATITVRIYIVRQTVAKRGGSGGSGSGTVTEVQAGEGIVVIDGTTTPTVSTDSAIIPRFYTGAGAPLSNCTEGEFYTDTTNDRLYTCVATDTWGYLAKITIATTAPGTCTVGDLFFDSDASAGSNLFGCTSTDTFTALGGGSASTQERSLYFPAAMRNTIGTNNIALWQSSTGTAYAAVTLNAYTILTFVDGSTSGMTTRFQMPYDWNGGTVTAVVHNVGYGSSSAEQHRIGVSVYCVNSGSDLADDTTDMAFGTFSTQAGAANELSYWTISGITARNCTAGEIGFVTLHRIGADAADTSTVAMAVVAAEVRYVSNQ